MALNYTQGVKNIMLSMSLDGLTPSGVGIGYGFGFRYSGSATGSVTGAYQLSNNYLLSNGTGSLHIYIPTGSYLNITTTTSESISKLVAKYNGSSVDGERLSTYIVVLQDSVISQIFLEPFAFVGLFTYNLREVVPLITDKTLDLGSMKLIA
jgi:hypothetical protein